MEKRRICVRAGLALREICIRDLELLQRPAASEAGSESDHGFGCVEEDKEEELDGHDDYHFLAIRIRQTIAISNDRQVDARILCTGCA